MVRRWLAAETSSSSLYLPALDGLRFLAFLLVFIHHLPHSGSGTFLGIVSEYGWIGVDVFFAISAYLLYHLLIAEHLQTGRIALSAFYARRFLRIYPLMLFFPIMMLIIFGPAGENWFQRLAGLAVGLDNFMCWIDGWDEAIPYSVHLWTLSYELQIYAILPLAFLGLIGISARKTFTILLAIELAVIVARWAFATGGAVHPVIWVTPFLRPESTLVGIAIAIAPPRPRRFLFLIVLVGAASLVMWGPKGTEMGNWTAILYVLIGLIAGSALLLTLQEPLVARFLSLPTIRYLGKISFGLYVYHVLWLYLGAQFFPAQADSLFTYAQLTACILGALGLTIATAMLSYRFLERPFLKLKNEMAVVQSRPL